MKKAGRKKPGPKKGWKLKGVRKAAEQKRAAKRTVKRKTTSSWVLWHRAAEERGPRGLIVEIGRNKAIRIQAVKIS